MQENSKQLRTKIKTIAKTQISEAIEIISYNLNIMYYISISAYTNPDKITLNE